MVLEAMAYIPKDARWYLADIVVELTIEDQVDNVVQINTYLVEASSPEQAYTKAQTLGEQENSVYENTDGKQVNVSFRGLKNLDVIHDPLEDGSEIMYTERCGVSKRDLEAMLCPKDQLGVFAPIEPKSVPNYLSREIAEEVDALIPARDPPAGRDQ